MPIYNIVAGVILLLFGRKLFWLFLGIAGFLFGMQITSVVFVNQPQWLQLSIALVFGCFGAIVAIFAQRLAFALGGFFAGVFLAIRIIQPFVTTGNDTLFFIVLGTGILGAIIATLLIDKAITFLACLIGAGAIVGELSLGHTLDTLIFVLLTGAGFVFQEKLLPGEKKG